MTLHDPCLLTCTPSMYGGGTQKATQVQLLLRHDFSQICSCIPLLLQQQFKEKEDKQSTVAAEIAPGGRSAIACLS